MTAMTPDLEVPASSTPVPGVLGKLEDTRRQIRQTRNWTALVSFVLGAFDVVAAFLLADWLWILPVAFRGLVVPALIALAAFILFRARRPYDRGAAAAEVEARFPTLGQRIRTLVQYHGPAAKAAPASPELLRELGRDTDDRTAALDFRKLVPWAKFERRAVGLFFAFAGGLVALFMVPSLRTAALRMMFLPAHYTTMKVEPGDLTVKAGEELKLQVTLSGRPVSSARWLYRETKNPGEWISASLAPDGVREKPAKLLAGILTKSLKDCQADLDYRVVAGDVESPVFHVRVIHPLVLKGLEAKVTPPPYTRRKQEVVKQGNLQVIEGSSVELQIALNHAPTSAELLLGGPGEASVQVPLLNIGDAKLAGRLPAIAKDVQYQINAVDAEGLKLEIAPFRIKVTPDQKPTLRFVRPEDSLAVTPTTEVPIEVEAGDDFGVSQVGITYKVGNGPEETLHLADYKDQPVTAQALATLYLEKHQIAYPDEISYYAFALDNYPPEPHRVVSELRFIDILPYKQEYQFAEGEGEPSSGSLSLEELIARQRVNLSRTFVLEGDRSIDEKAAMRLSTFEEELATATTEFYEGLKARGVDIPALDEAAGAMRSATAALDKKELPSAQSHEEAALKSLISVRRNLRKLLSLSSANQASECRKFDRQQVQKIRRPPQDKKEQLEADLMELAKREEEFSEEIEAKGGGGADVEPPPANEQQQAESPEDPAKEPSSKKPSSSPPTKSSASGKSSSKSTQSGASPVEQQQKAAAEAERLRQMAQKDKTLTDLAKGRLDAAAKMVQESSREMEAGRSAEAAEKAREAARKLEAAARQVGALKAKELADALARERDIAQAIAKAERELGKSLEAGAEPKPGETATASKPGKSGDRSGKAGRQRELADDVAALADVLERLRTGAALDYRELAQSIDRAARQNPPREVEDSMRRNAEAIESGRNAQAARDAEQAAQRLEALAQDLESVRRAAVQPQLERLLAVEKQAAEVQERLRSMRQASQLAEAEKVMADLAGAVDKLAPGEGSMRQAVDKLQSAMRGAHTGVLSRVDQVTDATSGYLVPPVGYNDGVVAVILALQAKIQEIILDSALAERDGPVPPRYKELVEDYYRVLSQDLR